MKPLDYLKALGVAMLTLTITLIASFPMVAFYAYVIEPGHPQEFYNDAAQWIAPWSSYVLGPIVLFALNFWLARHTPERNALLFAVVTIVFYSFVDFGILPLTGVPLVDVLTLTMGLALGAKLVGALLGASLGTRSGTMARAG